MLRVGLTGGLASGKSFVGRALADLGCLLIRADELGHQVLEPGGEAYDGVDPRIWPRNREGGWHHRPAASWRALVFHDRRAAGDVERAGASAGVGPRAPV